MTDFQKLQMYLWSYNKYNFLEFPVLWFFYDKLGSPLELTILYD